MYLIWFKSGWKCVRGTCRSIHRGLCATDKAATGNCYWRLNLFLSRRSRNPLSSNRIIMWVWWHMLLSNGNCCYYKSHWLFYASSAISRCAVMWDDGGAFQALEMLPNVNGHQFQEQELSYGTIKYLADREKLRVLRRKEGHLLIW